MKKLVLSVLLVAFSLSAQAGIKDKKAKKAVTTSTNTAIAKVKSACGNASLEAKIDWANWETYDFTKLSGNKAKHQVMNSAGVLITDVLGEVATLCKDADYKEELAKITKIAISGKKDQASMYVDFKLDKTTLNMSLNADGFASWKNKDLLKKVWE